MRYLNDTVTINCNEVYNDTVTINYMAEVYNGWSIQWWLCNEVYNDTVVSINYMAEVYNDTVTINYGWQWWSIQWYCNN